jgi:hypothetical protein
MGMYSWATTTWSASHDLWLNRLSEVGSSLPPVGVHSRQALVCLVQKWGRPVSHPLGPLGRGLVLRGLPSQWTPVVTLVLINFPLRSLEKFQIAFQVPEIK